MPLIYYLSEIKADSQGRLAFISLRKQPLPTNNGVVLTIAQIIKAVVSLAAEAGISLSCAHGDLDGGIDAFADMNNN